jgi:hypothetical protein
VKALDGVAFHGGTTLREFALLRCKTHHEIHRQVACADCTAAIDAAIRTAVYAVTPPRKKAKKEKK